MHTSPTSCPGCMAYRETLHWIDEQLRAATIKKIILARIAAVLTRGGELTAREPAWIWAPVHLSDHSPCLHVSRFDAPDRPVPALAQCETWRARDISWRKFVEVIDIALDAAYQPTRCGRCGFEVERCICAEVARHLEAIERLRRRD